MYNDGTSRKYLDLPILDTKRATTTGNISFNYSNPISISEALGGHVPTDIRYEDKLDDNNCLEFVLSNESSGFGTRIAGERLRNKVMNYLTRINAPSKINIDFSGISMISSSFADEFIGKLVAQLGFFRFTKIITLFGVAPTIELIINRSVSQRMAVMYEQ